MSLENQTLAKITGFSTRAEPSFDDLDELNQNALLGVILGRRHRDLISS